MTREADGRTPSTRKRRQQRAKAEAWKCDECNKQRSNRRHWTVERCSRESTMVGTVCSFPIGHHKYVASRAEIVARTTARTQAKMMKTLAALLEPRATRLRETAAEMRQYAREGESPNDMNVWHAANRIEQIAHEIASAKTEKETGNV